MTEAARSACFRIAGPVGAEAAQRVGERLAERIEHGILSAEEIERVKNLRLVKIAGDSMILEAFRRCCLSWQVDAPMNISSHRRFIGPILVAAKKAVHRVFRFQNEVFLEKQAQFNWHLLLVLRELLEDRERRRTQGEAADRLSGGEAPPRPGSPMGEAADRLSGGEAPPRPGSKEA